MANQLSPTKAAAAVSQALGEIGLPPTRKPPASSLLAAGRTIPWRLRNDPTLIAAHRSRPAPFTPGSSGRPWKTALGNQFQHVKNENQRVAEKKRLDKNVPQSHTSLAIHEEPAVHAPINSHQRSSVRGPFRLSRTNEIIQKNLQRQSQIRQSRRTQCREDGDTPESDKQFAIDPPSVPAKPDVVIVPEISPTNAIQGRVQQQKSLITTTSSPATEPPVRPLLRRKQAHQSLSPPLYRSIAVVLTPPKHPQPLFFQTAETDHESKFTSCSVISTTFDTDPETDGEGLKTEKLSPPAHKFPERTLRHDFTQRPSEERSGDDSSFRNTGAPEHIGKLSRQEDEFDFAILLKPSKYEEHVDLPETTTRSTATLKPIPKVDPTSDRAVIVSRIRRTGLHVKRLRSLDGKQSLLKVRAPQRVLELGAERLRLRKQRRFDHVWMVFSCELRSSFADFDPVRKCINFLDSEKQSIVHALLTASESDGGAGLNESCPVAARHVVQMYPLHKHDLALLKTRWVTFWRISLLSSKHQHDHQPTNSRSKCVVFQGLLQQPLDDVAQYFGERIAFYFAWMEMYTRWLVVPSIAGVILFGLQVHSHHLDHPAAPVYALFMALWTSAFIIAWRRRAAALAYHWGTWGYEDEEVTRPAFYSDCSASKPHDDKDVDDKEPGERHYSLWKRLLTYSVTFPCVAGSIVAVVTVAYFAFSIRDRLEAQSLETKHEAALIAEKVENSGTITLEDLRALAQLGVRWDFWIYLLLTPILYGLLIPVLDAAFTRAARWLNNWENHRTESRYQSHLILKVFSFRFVHVFASLYYYAFAPQAERSSEGESQAAKSDGMVRVAIQLASFMVTGQLWKNVMETLYPFVRHRLDARAKKRASNEQFNQSAVFNGINAAAAGPRGPTRHRGNTTTTTKLVSEMMMSSNAVIHEQCVRLEQASDRAWEEAGLKQYDTFEDYTEMLVQFGYVSFFSLAFPLAPLLALLNNLLELRTDAFKLCHTRQRPLAHKASGIGVWLHVLQIMSVLAVLTNCFHLAYSTSLLERALPSVSATQKVWIVFGIEHLLLLIKVWLVCVVPSVPREVSESLRRERELAKHDSARAMAVRMLAGVGAADSSDLSLEGSMRRRRTETEVEVDLHSHPSI